MILSVIILNWNAADDTIACVRSITAWKQLQPTIWVVDNASVDDSAEVIARACPTVHLIRNKINLGFAGGTNQGLLKALVEGDAPLLLLNNDASIAEADVIHLLETLRRQENVGLVGPLLYADPENRQLISAGGKNPVLHQQTRVRRYDTSQNHQIVEAISGTAILIQAEVFKTVGLLDEAYFFSTELADLCARARAKGYLSLIDTRATAYHDVKRSSRLRDTLHTYYIIRNRFLYIRKFYRLIQKGLLNTFWISYGLALTLKLYVAKKPASAKAVFLGLVDGVQGRFGGQNERVLAACSLQRVPQARPNGLEQRS